MNMKTKTITTCALFAALMCICGPLSIPIGPVPVTLTNLVIFFALMILGTKGTFISYLVYMLLGLVGLPVFSGFQGGVGKIAGPTGGYLIGFFLMLIIGGVIMEKTGRNNVMSMIGFFLGLVVAYAFGTLWFVHLMECDIPYALTLCVWPFLPFDIAKIVIAVLVGKTVRKSLKKANVLGK